MASAERGGQSSASAGDATTAQFFRHSGAERVLTDAVIARSLKAQYPNLAMVTVDRTTCDLLGFAAAGQATAMPVDDDGAGLPSRLSSRVYVPPARRMDGPDGILAEKIYFAKFLYSWSAGDDFIVYLVDGNRQDYGQYPPMVYFYILTAETHRADALIRAVGRWTNELHGELWVFDQGYWQKNAALYQSVQAASWDAVILDADMKQALIEDHLSFFRSRDTFARLKVPWKRGLLYYGPPGNGKTISIKATMKMLSDLDEPVPPLYVRSLVSFAGPQYAISQIFGKARQMAPCYLIFEDLDSIVTDQVRSYFLNEVDGLQTNDGIFMVGSTNHLDRLDPGISKRPSRFDRKYHFPDPNMAQREAYCNFWQSKLKDNEKVPFPDKLCTAIAEITDGFSFAYMQEAFVAALLAIASRAEDDGGTGGAAHMAMTEELGEGWIGVGALGLDDHEHSELDKYVLWVEIKKQIKILREGMKDEEAG